jgi:uncharacterized protein YehS (DUF1456 family)
MTNNDILIRLRYALNITDLRLVEIFALAGKTLSVEDLRPLFLKEEATGYQDCDGPTLGAFLEGLVTSLRGKRAAGTEAAPAKPGTKPGKPASSGKPAWVRHPSNNDVLKAVRVALSLREEDIVAIVRLAGVDASRSEINALFRKEGQENYRPCGDQFLRNFILGLTKKYRV